MNTFEQIDAIKTVMDEEVFNDDKLDRIEDILNPSISASELSAAQDESYRLGSEAGKANLFNLLVLWGIICGAAGYIIAFAMV